MKKEKNELLRLICGLGLLVAGFYWFASSVTVETGFYSWHIGSFRAGGLVVVPLVVGIVWMFADNESKGAKILSALGVLLIIASVVIGTTFTFKRRSLYEYIVMLVCIFGGAGLLLSVYMSKSKTKNKKDDEVNTSQNVHIENEDTVSRKDYDKLQNEINELREKYEKDKNVSN